MSSGCLRAEDNGAMVRVTFVLSLRWGCSARLCSA